MKQKIGTFCDNYKLEMFKKEFAAAGIEIVEIKPFMAGHFFNYLL